MKGLIDTHCHLIDGAFEDDLERVLYSAKSAGIEKIIVPAVNLTTSIKAVELAQKYTQLYAAVGVHPEETVAYSDPELTEFERLANLKEVVAIGEIGLDFHYQPFDEHLQKRNFSKMLELAARANKPVLIHSRDAIESVLGILKSWLEDLQKEGATSLVQFPGILHAFEGNLAQANQAIEMNFAIGLGGPITYKNSRDKVSIAEHIALDHLVLETDSPYLPPHPFRGQRNEPANILEIARKLAEIKNQSVEQIAFETGCTSTRILKLDGYLESID